MMLQNSLEHCFKNFKNQVSLEILCKELGSEV